jgi:transcriptional regulator with XRE-family HTH domain
LTAAGGAWLKQLREAKGMSQAELCSALGMKYRYQISHIEIGRSHLAPGYFEAYAESVGMEPREFVKKLLSFYSPLVYALLLENE